MVSSLLRPSSKRRNGFGGRELVLKLDRLACGSVVAQLGDTDSVMLIAEGPVREVVLSVDVEGASIFELPMLLLLEGDAFRTINLSGDCGFPSVRVGGSVSHVQVVMANCVAKVTFDVM